MGTWPVGISCRSYTSPPFPTISGDHDRTIFGSNFRIPCPILFFFFSRELETVAGCPWSKGAGEGGVKKKS